MIRITIEMLPGGREEGKRILASGLIWNDGTGSKYLGNYKYHLQKKTGRSAKHGRVINFQRRSKDEWELLKLVLDDYLNRSES